VNLLDGRGARGVRAHALEVGQHARAAVGDLVEHLRLVDELGAHDALDRALRLGLHRRPGLDAVHVGLEIRAHHACGGATRDGEQGDGENAEQRHAVR